MFIDINFAVCEYCTAVTENEDFDGSSVNETRDVAVKRVAE